MSEVRDQSPLDWVGVCRSGEGEVVEDSVTPPTVAVGVRVGRRGEALGEGESVGSPVGSAEGVGRVFVGEPPEVCVGLGMEVGVSDPEPPRPPPPAEVPDWEGEGVKEGLREEAMEAKGGRVGELVSRGERVGEGVKEMEGSMALGKGEGVERGALGVRVLPPPAPPLPPILGVGVGM